MDALDDGKSSKEKQQYCEISVMQPECHPIELTNGKITHRKLDYTHYNPVEAGFVKNPEDWKYSSAIDYHGGKGLLDIILLEPIIV